MTKLESESSLESGKSLSAPGLRLWKKAGTVMTAVKMSQGFKTLRDQVSGDAFIADDRLKKMKNIGEGGFATVELSTLDGLRLVAVKRLRTELLSNPDDVELFLKEVKLLRKLKHSRIVEYIGVGGSDSEAATNNSDSTTTLTGIPKELFLVQEYCPGGSLREIVYKQMCQPFTTLYYQADALRWALDIAKALKYLHSVKPKVIHRDLKLDNVLLSNSDISESSAKLADFGLAKLMASTATSQAVLQRMDTMMQSIDLDDPAFQARNKTLERTITRVTSSASDASTLQKLRSLSSAPPSMGRNAALPVSPSEASIGPSSVMNDMTGQAGSFSYMAPEVLRSEQYDERADIYSFGVMLYNMMYKVIPTVLIALNGTDEDVVLYAWKVANGYRPDFNASVPEEVNAVIEKCWKGLPELRPSAGEVVEMLERVEAGDVCSKGKVSGPGSNGCCSVM